MDICLAPNATNARGSEGSIAFELIPKPQAYERKSDFGRKSLPYAEIVVA
jgi:hypothetical protein